jgi:hypothetical protein
VKETATKFAMAVAAVVIGLAIYNKFVAGWLYKKA